MRWVCSVFLSASLLCLVCCAQPVLASHVHRASASPYRVTLPPRWNKNQAALAARFISLFDLRHRAMVAALMISQLGDTTQVQSFVRYMALVETLARRPDARLFFLLEAMAPLLLPRENRPYDANSVAREITLRGALLVGERKEEKIEEADKGELAVTRKSSTLTWNRTWDSDSHSWEMQFSVVPGRDAILWGRVDEDLITANEHTASIVFIAVRQGRFLFVPLPASPVTEFYVDNSEHRALERNDPGYDASVEACTQSVFFHGIEELTASLVQENEISCFPAYTCIAQCTLTYAWNGEVFVKQGRQCKEKGWGVWPSDVSPEDNPDKGVTKPSVAPEKKM